MLTVASGNVAFVGTPVCRSLDCNTYTGTLSGSAAVSIGDGTAGANSIALRLVSGQGYTATSTINFISTSATVQTIATGGKSLGAVTFNGVAGSWQNADNMTSTGIITGTNGTWDWNGKTISCTTCVRSGSAAFTMTPGAGAITCTAGGTSWSWATTTNLTVSANTATVTLSGAAARFSTSSFNWNGLSLVLSGSGLATIDNSPTFANLTRTGTAVKTDSFTPNGTITLTGVFTATGNSATNRLYVNSNTEGTARTIALGAAGTAVITNVTFRDITVTGTNTPIAGTSIGDALHNSGITFTAAVTRYRVGAGGTWSDTGWSTTSGGGSGSSVPLAQDTVFVDSGASGTITMDMPRLGADVDFSGFAGTASFSSLATTLYGSLTWSTGMTVSGTQTINFSARSTKSITSNGKAFTMTAQVSATAGTIQLADAFSGTSMTFAPGAGCTFDANNQNLTFTGAFTGLGSVTVKMGSGTWTLSGTGTIFSVVSTTVQAQTSTIAITDTSSSNKLLTLVSQTFNIITITAGGTGVVQLGTQAAQSPTIATLNLTGGAKNLRFFAGATYNITTWNVSGVASNLVTIDTTTAGTAATISKTSGNAVSDYISLKDSTATGGALFIAGSHSTNVSGNTGWQFGDLVSGSATLAGSGVLTSGSLNFAIAAASLAGSGVMTTAAIGFVEAAAALAGSGALTADSLAITFGAATLAGSGVLTSDSLNIALAAATLTGAGVLSADAHFVIQALAALVGNGVLSADGLVFIPASATLTGSGVLTADAFATTFSTASLAGSGVLTAAAIRVILGAANLSGQGTLSAAALNYVLAAAILAGQGTLTATIQEEEFAQAILSGRGVLTASALRIFKGPIEKTPTGVSGPSGKNTFKETG